MSLTCVVLYEVLWLCPAICYVLLYVPGLSVGYAGVSWLGVLSTTAVQDSLGDLVHHPEGTPQAL